MKYEPHDYQRYVTKYIESHPVAAVFLDMGLGKTSITLTALNDLLFDYFDAHRILVIAPLRVARNTWSDEIEKWDHLKDLQFSIAVGTEVERLSALKRQADIYIINRENLQWLIEKSGVPFDFDMVVIDELSSFKNHQAKKKYEDMKAELVLALPEGEITAANAASLSGKLSQMANGAVYADDESILSIHERKLDALEDIIEAANGKTVLVAYWFKHDLMRIEERLKSKDIPFEKLDSDASIKKWNKGELPVALIHPASAGHGLNLQSGGSTLVWFGITWSLELYQQTVARLYRQGQSEGTVTNIHILAKDTVDERIMKALHEKDSTQSALIDAVKAEL